jgi:hypothetical protein
VEFGDVDVEAVECLDEFGVAAQAAGDERSPQPGGALPVALAAGKPRVVCASAAGPIDRAGRPAGSCSCEDAGVDDAVTNVGPGVRAPTHALERPPRRDLTQDDLFAPATARCQPRKLGRLRRYPA